MLPRVCQGRIRRCLHKLFHVSRRGCHVLVRQLCAPRSCPAPAPWHYFGPWCASCGFSDRLSSCQSATPSGPGNACDQLALLLIALCLQLIAHDSNPLKPCLRRRWDSPHLCVRIIICAIVRRGLAHGLLPEGTLVRALTNRMSGADGSEVRELVRVTVRLGELFVLNEY